MPRHSPVIFWLLLAATLCVDVVTSVWFSQSLVQPQSRPLSSATLLIALAYAQVSLVCIRAVLRRSTNWIQWLMPFGAGIVVATIIIVEGIYEKPQREFPWAVMLAYTSFMWVHVASLLFVLWLLKPTRLFARDVVAAGRSRWQFTIRHLLLLMTCLPILVIVFMNSEIVHSGVTASGTAQFVAWVTGNVVLPVVVVAIVERR